MRRSISIALSLMLVAVACTSGSDDADPKAPLVPPSTVAPAPASTSAAPPTTPVQTTPVPTQPAGTSTTSTVASAIPPPPTTIDISAIPTTTLVDPESLPAPLPDDAAVAAFAEAYDTNGYDLIEVSKNWVALFDALFEEPTGSTVAVLAMLYGGSIQLDAGFVAEIDSLFENNWRYAPGGRELVAVRVEQQTADTATVLWADRRGPDRPILDADGAVVRATAGWELKVRLVELVSSPVDGRWRVSASTTIQDGVTIESLEAQGFVLVGGDG